MVIQYPATHKDNAFVTSDSPEVDDGRREVDRWLTFSDYAQRPADRVFVIFDNGGEIVREWNVVERPRNSR